jgi:hypothetical protein
MSRKTKPKRKRGQTIDMVEFVSPLSLRECISHLEAGPSPLKNYELEVDIEGESFQIKWVHLKRVESPFQFQRIAMKDTITQRRWSAPIWLEGTLTPTDSGLVRVHGRALREFGASNTARAIRFGLILALLAVISVTVATYQSDRALWAWWLLVCVVLVLIVVDFISRKRTGDRFTRELLHYLSERLDVQRG